MRLKTKQINEKQLILKEKSSKKYSKISLKKRVTLIKNVFENGKNIYKAAKESKIKYSTAKAIILRYKKAGETLILGKSHKEYLIQSNLGFEQQGTKIQFQDKSLKKEPSIEQKQEQKVRIRLSADFLISCWFGHFMLWRFCNAKEESITFKKIDYKQ